MSRHCCARCKQPGHYAPTCPAPAPVRPQMMPVAKPARPASAPKPEKTARVKRPRLVRAVAPPRVFVPPADRPYHHVSRVQNGPNTPDLPGYVHTWRHIETGAEIVATFPPFSWDDSDGMVVLRHIRDAAQIAKAHPRAVVSER